MKSIVLASNNQGKLKEFQTIFASHLTSFQLISGNDKTWEVEETGLTFVENALIKARAASKVFGQPTIADDSGLIVPALNGEPGIYSARYAGTYATSQENCTKLQQKIQLIDHSERHAYFHCAIVLLQSERDPTPIIVEASWHGLILDNPRGENGFGYDSLFYIPSLDCTAAELSPEKKNQQSHRALALKKLEQILRDKHS